MKITNKFTDSAFHRNIRQFWPILANIASFHLDICLPTILALQNSKKMSTLSTDSAYGQKSEHIFTPWRHVYIYSSNIFCNTHSLENWGISHSFSWVTFSRVTRLDQFCTSKYIWIITEMYPCNVAQVTDSLHCC